MLRTDAISDDLWALIEPVMPATIGRPGRRAAVTAGVRLGGRDRALLVLAVLPAVAILVVAQAYPLGYSFYVSLQDWSLTQSIEPQGFVGLDNYVGVVQDPDFRHALLLSLMFLCTVPVELVLGLSLAYFTQGEGLSIRTVRTVLIFPMVLAPIAVGTIFRLLLDPQSGFLTLMMRAVGLPDINWLGSAQPAVISVLVADIWQWMPFSMIIYAAALTTIDANLIEAARLDRASSWQVVRHVLIPMVVPATVIICVFRVVDAFLTIDVVFSMTGGGPGTATQTSSLWIFDQGLSYFNVSQAAAASWIIVAICLGMAFTVLRVGRSAEHRLRGRR